VSLGEEQAQMAANNSRKACFNHAERRSCKKRVQAASNYEVKIVLFVNKPEAE
jgi:hypothetical protein